MKQESATQKKWSQHKKSDHNIKKGEARKLPIGSLSKNVATQKKSKWEGFLLTLHKKWLQRKKRAKRESFLLVLWWHYAKKMTKKRSEKAFYIGSLSKKWPECKAKNGKQFYWDLITAILIPKVRPLHLALAQLLSYNCLNFFFSCRRYHSTSGVSIFIWYNTNFLTKSKKILLYPRNVCYTSTYSAPQFSWYTKMCT